MPINTTIPRLEKAWKFIEDGDVILLEFGRAVVHSKGAAYHVNYTSEKCECYDNSEAGFKCKHIWAAQLIRQRELEQGVKI